VEASEGKKLSDISQDEFIEKYLMMELKLADAKADLAKAKKTHDLVTKKLKEKHKEEVKKYNDVQSYADIKDEDDRIKNVKTKLIEKNKKIVEL
jgi:hypothetical protein